MRKKIISVALLICLSLGVCPQTGAAEADTPTIVYGDPLPDAVLKLIQKETKYKDYKITLTDCYEDEAYGAAFIVLSKDGHNVLMIAHNRNRGKWKRSLVSGTILLKGDAKLIFVYDTYGYVSIDYYEGEPYPPDRQTYLSFDLQQKKDGRWKLSNISFDRKRDDLRYGDHIHLDLLPGKKAEIFAATYLLEQPAEKYIREWSRERFTLRNFTLPIPENFDVVKYLKKNDPFKYVDFPSTEEMDALVALQLLE